MKKGIFVLVLGLSLYGCGSMSVRPLDKGFSKDVEMKHDKDLGRVYLAPGFNFKGYDILFISDISTNAILPKKGINPDELAVFFKHALIEKLKETEVFPTVTDDVSVLSSKEGQSPKVLILEGAISDLQPGNKALRAVAGLGAGAVKAQVEIECKDNSTKQMLFKSSDRRADPGGIGLGGIIAAEDSEKMLMGTLETVAKAHGSFIKRIASNGKIEEATEDNSR